MVNLISNQKVDYSNSIGIGGNFNFIYMDTITRTIQESLNKFSVNAITGQQMLITNAPNLGLSVIYLESSSNYELKFSVKLLARGLYFIGLTDLISQGIRGQNCTNAGFNITVTNTNKHFNLFQYALNYSPDALLQKSIYCFRVQ
jgi:hypothetical protein